MFLRMERVNEGGALRQMLFAAMVTRMLLVSPAFLPVERALKCRCPERCVVQSVHPRMQPGCVTLLASGAPSLVANRAAQWVAAVE